MDLDRYFQEHSMGGSAQVLPEGFRSGFVALVGRPNAGKSTLLNSLMGSTIAITSSTSQTTRKRIRAVLTKPDFQLVIVDTPGIHKPIDVLGEELNAAALGSLADVDVIAMLIDTTQPVGTGDEWVASQLNSTDAAKILVLSKCDIATPEQTASQLELAKDMCDWDAVVSLSGKTGYNTDAFVEECVEFLPEGPKWFPDDMRTDQTDEEMISEFIREKVLRQFREEIPHSVGVQVDSLEYSRKRGLYSIHATIYTERESQKAILIGKHGSAIKSIGTGARKDLERLLGAKVYLELSVKVKRNWRSDEAQLRRFGYME